MIESFKKLEEVGRDRDLATVFLEADEREHAVPAGQIVAALTRRREVMRDCIERGRANGGMSMGKLVGNEASKLAAAFAEGRTFLDPLTIKAESSWPPRRLAPAASCRACCWPSKKSDTSLRR